MAAHPVIIDRLELYGRVWAQPLNQLAKEYGISDVALAKTCRKGNFPLPGRGYWAKIAAGRRIKPTPLPTLPAQASNKISIGESSSLKLCEKREWISKVCQTGSVRQPQEGSWCFI